MKQEDLFVGEQLRLLPPEMEPARKENMDQWFTDPELAEEFVEWCRLKSTDVVLEPTIGCGNLLKPILKRTKNVIGYELDEEWVAYCRKKFPEATINDAGDFLDIVPPEKKVDVCVMNPPLSDGMDGVFLSRIGLYWAHRTCAIIQTRTFHSGVRRRTLWDLVRVVDIEFISDRPSFGRGSPMRDFSFVCIEPRSLEEGRRQRMERDSSAVGFL